MNKWRLYELFKAIWETGLTHNIRRDIDQTVAQMTAKELIDALGEIADLMNDRRKREASQIPETVRAALDGIGLIEGDRR